MQVDWTSAFRALARVARGDADALAAVVPTPERFAGWLDRWIALAPDPDVMDRVNPLYIPRNHLVEDALTQATVGDLAPYHRLLDAVTRPFDERPGLRRLRRSRPARLRGPRDLLRDLTARPTVTTRRGERALGAASRFGLARPLGDES